MENKIKIIQKLLKEKEMIFIDDPEQVFDLLEKDLSFNYGEYDANLFIGKRKVYLIVDYLLYPEVKNIGNVELVKGDTLEYLKNGKLFLKEWLEILKGNGITRVGLLNSSFSLYFKDFVTFKFISPSKTLGSYKSKNEISKIIKIAQRMEKIFGKVEEMLKVGIKDVHLRNAVDLLIYEDGFKRYLPTYVGFDPKTIYPTLNGDILKNNRIVVLDIGIMKSGVGFSFSKSFPFGKLSKNKEKILNIAKDGIDVLLASLLKNNRIKECEMGYREYLKSHKLEKMSIEYGFSYVSCAGTGEVNTFITERTVKNGEIFKLTSSIFLPSKYGVRFESLIIKNGKGYEKIL
ncbi:MAG: M24 family metallopeptidase [bacterium]|uniref:Peptidase M24 domain-containing protein n=2 Tax=Bacteria candidate phyla TaxID=1783234 RepID=A0A101I275_UNCT6|nr:MAG: hypothetical protein XD76_0301 [candidate division TA06 bacterium 32_111]KUK87666.1 MAG: hypothetical protein XE03_0557 [candidate division TA06 bacterium 34_109]MDI6699800.1 M24 family metallopeptidase [bacterium]HAF07505.1 hypothetical protein [candidate division WOR-3 bacterium]HCP17574.1 hypothetical protein [candidate division WOR-3 bacterium]